LDTGFADQFCRHPSSLLTMPPTAKEIKYDRQLRLWSANGQAALENARLCLINATATGTEILKNLVLPGFLLSLRD
jgi:NEDD8-activating enzyme E1 regulatory subunit